jgi:hypothetical protein
LFVNSLTQRFAGFEADGSRRRDRDAFSIAWITADTGWSMCDGKAAKATDFDSMTGCQGVLHGVKNGIDRQLYVILGEVLKMFSQFVYEVRAVHCDNRNLVSSRIALRNGAYLGGADGGWANATSGHRH